MRTVMIALALALSVGAAVADSKWQTFHDPKGAFTVDLPGTPAVQGGQIPTNAGAIPAAAYTVNLGTLGTVVSDADFSGSNVDRDKALQGSVDAMKSGKTVLSESEDKLDGVSGRALKLQKDNRLLSVRVFFVRDHLYQAMALVGSTQPTAEQSAIVERFLKSFHFTKKK
jgi:hypothetical protein